MTVHTTAHAQLPASWRLGVTQLSLEVRTFLRNKDSLLFTLGLPLLFLVVFGLVFAGELEGTTVSVGQWFTPGIIAASILSAGIVNLPTSMAIERLDGSLKRLALTPLPAISYLTGKVLMTLVTAAAMTAVLLGVGMAFFGVSLPTEPDRWATFAWVFGLGVAASAVMGIALSVIPRSAKSASAVFNLPFLALMFISGVFIDSKSIPDWLWSIAGLFPLRWMASGMRSVFLPPEYEQIIEPGGSYNLEIGAMVLAVWAVAGLIAAITTFRFGRERRH